MTKSSADSYGGQTKVWSKKSISGKDNFGDKTAPDMAAVAIITFANLLKSSSRKPPKNTHLYVDNIGAYA